METRVQDSTRSFCAKPALLLAVVLLAVSPALPKGYHVRPLTPAEFVSLIQRVSEDDGFFWNDNYVSNESSYQHPLKKLRELGIQGGIYVGVGPNQNFTYIANVHPDYAFILDIRRQNMLEHLLFKSLFHYARDRADYLSLLLSRPVRPGSLPGDAYTVEDLVKYFQSAEPDSTLFERTGQRVREFLDKSCHMPLSDRDLSLIDKILQAFFSRGLSIKYDYIPVPTYAEFLLEKDIDGNRQNLLNSTQDFLYVKRLEEENRIIPVVGDFAGSHAFNELRNVVTEWNERVTVFYASNVEQYLLRNHNWPQFLKNVSTLPLDDRAVFIRAYWSDRLDHPDLVPGYSFATVLQWAKPFLYCVNPSGNYSYWDIVTLNTIKLK